MNTLLRCIVCYFWSFRIFFFFSLGATHDVAPQLSAEQLSQGSYGASDIVRLPIKEATETEDASRATTAAAAAEVVVICATRARMLILNFLFIRYVVCVK